MQVLKTHLEFFQFDQKEHWRKIMDQDRNDSDSNKRHILALTTRLVFDTWKYFRFLLQYLIPEPEPRMFLSIKTKSPASINSIILVEAGKVFTYKNVSEAGYGGKNCFR